MSNSKIKFPQIVSYDWKKLFFELIVVFLGVTAGFILNNWRMQKDVQNTEQKYLNGFHQDIVANITELSKSIKSDSLWLVHAKPKLLSIQNGTIKIDSANYIIKLMVSISKASLQTGTYEEIINSGNLNTISNFNIKKQIVDYHEAINGVGFIDDYFYRYFNNFVMPFIYSNFSILKGKLEDPLIIKTNQFANVVAGYYSMVQQRKSAYQDLLNKSFSLKAKLEVLISD